MTENEIKFLLQIWGREFTTATLTHVSQFTKSPNDSVVLAIALKKCLEKIEVLEKKIAVLKSNPPPVSGFDISDSDKPHSVTV